MCDYIILARSERNVVRWCRDCGTYSLTYNNIVANFSRNSFEGFKENVSQCYAHNRTREEHLDRRDIFFNTKEDGLQFLFSTKEVGELYRLLQNAASYLELVVDLDHQNLN